MSFEKPENFQKYTLSPEEAKTLRPLTEEEQEELGIGKKEGSHSRENVDPILRTTFQNPETGQDQPIEINFEDELKEQKQFYKEKLNIDLDESKVREIWSKHYAEIKSEIEKYGYDSILIVPDNLPEEADLNRDLIETMEETVDGQQKKVTETYRGGNFESGGSFAGVRNSYTPKYRLVLTHGVQNIEDHPILKATRNKNIPMLILNISPKEWNDMEDKEKEKKTQEAFQKLEQGAGVDFEAEIDGKKINIQAEGCSLEEYMLRQRMYFKKYKKHLDEKGWTWLLKSLSGPRVVYASWCSGDRRLIVYAIGPSDAFGDLGLRLSRSFSN